MSESLTDEQLADWDRETHDGDHPRSSMLWRVHALIQEVRRLREECDIGARRGRLLEAGVERLRKKPGANIGYSRHDNASTEMEDWHRRAFEALLRVKNLEAERDRYKAVVGAARELYLVMKSHRDSTDWMFKWQRHEQRFLDALRALDQPVREEGEKE